MAKTDRRGSIRRLPKQIDAAIRAAEDKKAVDLVVLDLRKAAGFTDYFVICSAQSERQVQAIARHVQDTLSTFKKKPLGLEGLEEGNWVLIDFGDVIFHAFLDTARTYYNLEGFWGSAERIPVKEVPKANCA